MLFRSDLRRWERGETITARPISTIERGWRWVCRNPAVSTLIASTLLAIVLGSGASLWFAARATRESAERQVEAARARLAEGQERDSRKFAEQEASKARAAEQQARLARERAETEARRASESEAAAKISEAQTIRTLARSNYFLAQSRWSEGRVREANEFLARVPAEHRHIEWGLAAREFEGSELTLTGHTAAVTGVAYSPDGTRIVSSSDDHTLKVWDAATGETLLTLTGHSGLVTSVAYSPDGTRIVSCGQSYNDFPKVVGANEIKVWDAATGESLLTLTGHAGDLRCVAYSPDGTSIVSGTTAFGKIDGRSGAVELKVWDAEIGRAHV